MNFLSYSCESCFMLSRLMLSAGYNCDQYSKDLFTKYHFIKCIAWCKHSVNEIKNAGTQNDLIKGYLVFLLFRFFIIFFHQSVTFSFLYSNRTIKHAYHNVHVFFLACQWKENIWKCEKILFLLLSTQTQ